MKTLRKIYLLLSVSIIVLSGCKDERPFPGPEEKGMGTLSLAKFSMDVNNGEFIIRNSGSSSGITTKSMLTRAVDTSNFIIEIRQEGSLIESYKYSEMPEVIVLPVGTYHIKAHSGDNPTANWDVPYFEGSTEVEIKKDQLTEPEPITCTLSNVKVTVIFDEALKKLMGDDSYVHVKVGESGELNFTKNETRSGYFAHVENSTTIVAEFNGTVDGDPEKDNLYTDNRVAPGVHYKITYRLHDPSADIYGSGTLFTSLNIDGKVVRVDYNINYDSDPEPLDDIERPRDGVDPGVNPNPGPGGNDGSAPKIEGLGSIDLTKDNIVGSDEISLLIISEAEGGILDFTVQITSTDQGFCDAIEEMGLSSFNLVEPGDLQSNLELLGFKCGDDVKGQNELTFTITSDLLMLLNIYKGRHTFTLSVTDANGTTTKYLRLVVQ